MKKLGKVCAAVLALLLVASVSVFADGSYYFEKYTLWNSFDCYELPESLGDGEVSDDTVFYIPVALYDALEAIAIDVADAGNSGDFYTEEESEALNDLLYLQVWNNEAYDMLCDEDSAEEVNLFWNTVVTGYYQNNELAEAIYDCLPNFVYDYANEIYVLTNLLAEMDNFYNGNSLFDSEEEIIEYYVYDVMDAVDFFNTYFPEADF